MRVFIFCQGTCFSLILLADCVVFSMHKPDALKSQKLPGGIVIIYLLQTLTATPFPCIRFQLGSLSSAVTAPTAPPRRATWRLTSFVCTVGRLTTVSTLTAAFDVRTHPRCPPDCLWASRETTVRQRQTRSAWHPSAGLDVIVLTAHTDSYGYCFSFTSKGLGWWRLLKRS